MCSCFVAFENMSIVNMCLSCFFLFVYLFYMFDISFVIFEFSLLMVGSCWLLLAALSPKYHAPAISLAQAYWFAIGADSAEWPREGPMGWPRGADRCPIGDPRGQHY